MTQTTTELLIVDGVVLNTLAMNIESLTGRLRTPPVRTGNIVVPGRHGSVRTHRKRFGEGDLILPMWVRGTNADGGPPASGTARQEFFANVDKLAALFRGGQELLDVRHVLPAVDDVRQAYCEVLQVLDFSVWEGQGGQTPGANFIVSLTIPAAFWQDLYPVTTAVTTAPAQTVSLTDFEGATAPMDDLIYTFTGPITNPEIQAYRNNLPLPMPIWMRYNGTVPDGCTLQIDCSTWQLVGTGFTPTYSSFVHYGETRWMVVQPHPTAGVPQIRYLGTGTSGSTRLDITGRRKYLVG